MEFKCTKDDLQDFFRQHRQYFMLHQDEYANHITSVSVSLYRIGASKEKIQQFIDSYSPGLESHDGPTATSQLSKETDVVKLLGAKKNSHVLFSHYKDVLEKDYNSDLKAFIREEFQKLSIGLMSAAFHGMIQIAYSYVGEFTDGVIEGFAYFHHSYLPLALPDHTLYIGGGKRDILDVLKEFEEDKELRDFAMNGVPVKSDKQAFSKRLRLIINERSGKLMDYVKQIKMPLILNQKSTMEDAIKLSKWVVKCAVVVYVKSEVKNDFFLLHGVTGSWSLLQIIKLLTDPEKALFAIQTFLCCLLAVYRTQRCPSLIKDIDKKSLMLKTWHDIITSTLKESREGHVYKLIHVAYDMAQDADEEEDILYKTAANCALETDLFFFE